VIGLDVIVGVPSVRCHAAGSSSSSTTGDVGARSDTTSLGAALAVPSACRKHRWAALASRHTETNTSVSSPNRSIARYRWRHWPVTFTWGLVCLPAVTDGVPAGPGSLSQQRCEPLQRPVDGDVVDLDAPLGEQLLDIAVGQAEAQVPADREDDDVWWEAKACKAD
jgi:hypothetical protein